MIAILVAASTLAAGCDQQASSSGSSSSASTPANGAATGGPDSTNAGARSASPAASAVDQQYAAILSAIVNENGLVRYVALAQEPLKAQLDAVVAGYAAEKLPHESQSYARMALWCNAYNANMLKIGLEEGSKAGFDKFKQSPRAFEKRQIKVAGETMTAAELRDRLRAMHDPRVHAALVFAARSCPPLRNEPYAADRLEEQLHQQAFAWVEDFGKNRLAQDALMLSPIFEWHAADFDIEPYGGAAGFVKKHARPNGLLGQFVRKVPDPNVRYVSFDWALNDAGEE